MTNLPDRSEQLLEGVRVIDLTRILAGPYCTMLLGDLGADIIKIEFPERGDDTRQWGPPFTAGGQSAYFLAANRNKRSLTLDLKSERGMEILKALIQTGDVLIENFRAGTLEKWGLAYEQLQELKPDLVYCTVTGYGYTGPYRDRPGYDFVVQALGGFMSVTGPEDGQTLPGRDCDCGSGKRDLRLQCGTCFIACARAHRKWSTNRYFTARLPGGLDVVRSEQQPSV